MDIITVIKNIYQEYITNHMSEYEIDGELIAISLRFEYDHSLSTADLVKAVTLLIEYVLVTKSSSVRESLLNAVSEAIRYRKVSEFINWDNLVAHLDQLSIDALLEVFYFLTFSKKESYIPILEKYTHHPNKLVREDARRAIEGIQEDKHRTLE